MDQFDTAVEASTDVNASTDTQKHQVLHALGERVRQLRARRGLTRRSLAHAADVSERHLANLGYGSKKTNKGQAIVGLQLRA